MAPGAATELDSAACAAGLTGGQQDRLNRYVALVRRWNQRINLVSRRDLERFADRHLADALSLLPLFREILPPQWRLGCRVTDIGSGAGLPGLPLAVAAPELTVQLVERSQRKATFLRHVRRELNLPNLVITCADAALLPREAAEVVTARAVLPPEAVWRLALPHLTPGGYMLALDRIVGSRQATEQASDETFSCPGGSIAGRRWIRIPALATWHGVLIVRKDAPNSGSSQSEGRRRQDHHGGEPGGVARVLRQPHAADRP